MLEAHCLRQVATLSSQLGSNAIHADVLTELRAIERKMGLVLTLFKASVWAIVQEQTDAQEDADLHELHRGYDGMGVTDEWQDV